MPRAFVRLAQLAFTAKKQAFAGCFLRTACESLEGEFLAIDSIGFDTASLKMPANNPGQPLTRQKSFGSTQSKSTFTGSRCTESGYCRF
ncbi:hypothetical protein CLOSTMETH_02254 [[Clostridium] methylpentosum DSM 5476]|uniref:Uncharacterized protein n=1 Tax=[Clostridium] methylpentosum DSM 5476 TaxID=537013 RepID=C0EEG8_9FIRM|nr:hypothetical protein CLOSTMETH_02254 [[Clostridium] methylpentosum DSM 5476]